VLIDMPISVKPPKTDGANGTKNRDACYTLFIDECGASSDGRHYTSLQAL